MSNALTVSVVIVSRDRPDALGRCLTGLTQQFHSGFEVVVVADAAGLTAVEQHPNGTSIKRVAFDEPNISEARNRGIAAAAGDVVAFIDDDSVPEPTWLHYLVAPFAQGEVSAAGGFVRGRNGISWQARSGWVDACGQEHPLDVSDQSATLMTGAPGRAIKTEGTNMAFRRSWLAERGGFDSRFRFFLDETDVNMRLASEGAVTAVVPLAQVHHGFAASDRRRADRVPHDLSEIGASWAVFLRKHCPEDRRDARWRAVQHSERQRLLRHMVSGGLEPGDVRRLLKGLRQGFADGLKRMPATMPSLPRPIEPFRVFVQAAPGTSVVVAGRFWSRRSQRHKARQAVAKGQVVSVFRFSRSALFHRVVFRPQGYWEQIGGLFGKSTRSQPVFQPVSFRKRLQQEIDRIRTVRAIRQDGK